MIQKPLNKALTTHLPASIATGLAQTSIPAFTLSVERQIIWANAAFLDLIQCPDTASIPETLQLPENQQGMLDHALTALFKDASGNAQALPNINLITCTNEHLDVEINLSRMQTEEGLTGILGLIVDNEPLRRKELELRKLFNAVENSGSAVLITDQDGAIEYVNRRFTDITGYRLHEVVGMQPSFLKSGNTGSETYKRLWETVRNQQKWRGTLQNRTKSGDLYWCLQSISPILDESGNLTNIVSVSDDVTTMKQHHQQMEKLAYFDPLTELGNRRCFRERLAELIQSHNSNLNALLLLDLDHFKKINDSMGHEAGDTLLQVIANRLRFCVNQPHSVFRLGGDEFTVILRNLEQRSEIERYAKDIIELLSQPVNIGSHQIQVTVSIGVTLPGADADDTSNLIRNADLAMYHAKNTGRNNYCFFDSQMNAQAQRALMLEHDLHYALERDELYLVYQPQIDLETEQPTGMEALLRWRHPTEGEISPVEFIPMAEETGLIISIGRWIIYQSAAACRRLQIQTGNADFRVAVNVSVRQFEDQSLIDTVSHALKMTGLDASTFELEITERLMMQDINHSISMLDNLRHLGISIAVDDFGTGYSSLSYLKKMPLDVLKIDRSFVKDIPGDSDDLTITSTIILLARQLGLRVMAEGVETQQQRDVLLSSGCGNGQGFLYSRPVELSTLIDAYGQQTVEKAAE